MVGVIGPPKLVCHNSRGISAWYCTTVGIGFQCCFPFKQPSQVLSSCSVIGRPCTIFLWTKFFRARKFTDPYLACQRHTSSLFHARRHSGRFRVMYNTYNWFLDLLTLSRSLCVLFMIDIFPPLITILHPFPLSLPRLIMLLINNGIW